MEDDYDTSKDERHRRGFDANPKKRLNVVEVQRREAMMEKRNEQRNRQVEASTASSSSIGNVGDFDEFEDSKSKNKKKAKDISTKMSKEEKQKLYQQDMEECDLKKAKSKAK